MKINSLYISAFGGIKNLKLDFCDGFNIVYGENEDGKTTVMAFIKMMLYGSERGSSQLSKSIRKKYTPWDGSPMAGSLDFEHSGKSYRIEREFRLSNSTDKVTLYDLTLGERQTAPPDIGKKFLGLSSAAFERSVFIGQFGFPEGDSAAEGEINSKLANLALTGDENISFEKVNARLESAKTALMSKSGRVGEYDKNSKLCTQLKERTEAALAKIRECDFKKRQIADLSAESLKISEKAEKLKLKIESERDIRSRERLKEYLQLKERLDGLNSELRLKDGSLADEMLLRKLRFCISKYEAADEKYRDKLKLSERLKADMAVVGNPPENTSPEFAAELKAAIKAAEEKRDKSAASELMLKMRLSELEKKSASPSRIVAAAVSAAGALLLVASLPLKIFLGAVFLPCLLTAVAMLSAFPVFALSSKRKSVRISAEKESLTEKLTYVKTEISKYEAEISKKRSTLERVTTALTSTAAVIESKQKMLEETESELYELNLCRENEKAVLLETAAKYSNEASLDNIDRLTEEIAEKAAKQKEIKQRLGFIASELNNISYEEAGKRLSETENSVLPDSTDFEALKKEYADLNKRLEENMRREEVLKTEITMSAKSTENPEELKRRLKELLKRTAEQKQFCLAADLAREALLESFTELRKSYGSALEKTAGEFFSELTQSKYNGMTVSKAFDINVTEADAFGSRELAYLSSGAEDQAYLSLRLAITRLISDGKEQLPVFLDDSLAQYDDVRMKNATACLKRASNNSQTIMFTCHNAVRAAAEDTGAKTVYL